MKSNQLQSDSIEGLGTQFGGLRNPAKEYVD